ncbi:hypothetical protein ASE74_23525 [Pedobacter sp. Leaf216]|uniref:hypothetical protein n=1 Tax=Pedobacter sp. Leaf216 TaxID=1735684 RepID=UPI0006FD4F0A|nr:hypothetical protein [Pedobacter sp. Leaf216]KQM70354.1 hypothetical protein ASE74_23525 [Pedobacter sp. Leaf216]
MIPIFRLFLTVEGENDAYPNYNSAVVHLTDEDPAELSYQNLFISSPLFSPYTDGTALRPVLRDGTEITFLMVPEVYPTIHNLLLEFSITNELWFTIGLANIVIIDELSCGLAQKIIDYLESLKNITAYERWSIAGKRLDNSKTSRVKNFCTSTSVHHSGIKISALLPLYLKFAVSEFIVSVDKLLTASKKFTPHYFDNHKSTISAASDLISDLSFLHGDNIFTPSEAILNNLKVKNIDEGIAAVKNPLNNKIIQDLINDRHGMIIQFNSSLSYIYSQAYSGTFPIFDHIGIVRRHSLLGLGTAIGSLYELIKQLEKAFFRLPFEDFKTTVYYSAPVPKEYFSIIVDPSFFSSSLWKEDAIKQSVVGSELKAGADLPDDFFHRLSFFSGRLGFREYEFSATAAIQVIVESYKLPWHIINYTHEIIHNHVRLILNQLIIPPNRFRDEPYLTNLSRYIGIITESFEQTNVINGKQISYFDYFVTLLVKFVMNAEIYGSLTSQSDYSEILACQSDPERKIGFYDCSAEELKDQILFYYKDITEIFVHVIDFCYIYKQKHDIYLLSIWTSWATIPAVANDLKQYILRTLIILGLSAEGKVYVRFDRALALFNQLLSSWQVERPNPMFDKIIILLKDTVAIEDLKYRFYNCTIVGDLVYNYFVGKLETLLDNNDQNNLSKDNLDDAGNPNLYYISTNSFEGEPIESKVRFLLNQLSKEVYSASEDKNDDFIEKTSAWLLLSLSTCKTL